MSEAFISQLLFSIGARDFLFSTPSTLALGVHRASCPMCTHGTSLARWRSGREVDHLTSMTCRVRDYLYLPRAVPLWRTKSAQGSLPFFSLLSACGPRQSTETLQVLSVRMLLHPLNAYNLYARRIGYNLRSDVIARTWHLLLKKQFCCVFSSHSEWHVATLWMLLMTSCVW